MRTRSPLPATAWRKGGCSKKEPARNPSGKELFTVDRIDEFKRINDAHGHDAGDLALQASSRKMVASLRKQDVIARWGGEEFLVLLPESGIEEGQKIAGLLLQAIAGRPLSSWRSRFHSP